MIGGFFGGEVDVEGLDLGVAVEFLDLVAEVVFDELTLGLEAFGFFAADGDGVEEVEFEVDGLAGEVGEGFDEVGLLGFGDVDVFRDDSCGADDDGVIFEYGREDNVGVLEADLG